MKCKKCNSTKVTATWVTHGDGTKHIKNNCETCGAHNGFAAQGNYSFDELMPFGKHKGRTLEDLCVNEKDYVEWAIQNMNNKGIVAKLVSVSTEVAKIKRVSAVSAIQPLGEHQEQNEGAVYTLDEIAYLLDQAKLGKMPIEHLKLIHAGKVELGASVVTSDDFEYPQDVDKLAVKVADKSKQTIDKVQRT